jgi:type II secretory pathway component PulK
VVAKIKGKVVLAANHDSTGTSPVVVRWRTSLAVLGRSTVDSRRAVRRGLILPVMLVILLLLALLVASFSFQVQAEYSAGVGMKQRLQSRLAAEAGVHAAMVMLRSEQDNVAAWYHNAEAFDQALVWSPDATIEELGKGSAVRQAEETVSGESRAVRFSLVADDPDDVESKLEDGKMRFGITDEASKLNLNTATEEQLLRLLQPVVLAMGHEPGVELELVYAILDWRDADDEPGSEEKPAESAYYRTLDPPYRAKNAPFESVEELLMVRGFNGRVLYGEDYDRNGLISANEDDGDDIFPPDNADGVLERGIYPYLTVYSHEYNVAVDNKPRVNLFGETAYVQAKLSEIFERPEVVDFILKATVKTGPRAIRSLGDYLQPRIISDRETPSPLNAAETETLFEKCTIDSEAERFGLVNVNTAQPPVLRALGLSPESIGAILTARRNVPASQRMTTAWLLTSARLSPEEYALVQNQVTARGRQFTIESIGYSDDRGVFTRLEAVVAMRGPVPQLVYSRDITKLGMGFPVRGQEGERRFALRAEE